MTDPFAPPRRLVLLRHAKSAWPQGVADHERPLAARGQRAAPLVGRWLRGAGQLPDAVLCSTARRTRETWQLVREQLGTDPPAVFDEQLYGAGPSEALELIHGVGPACRTLLVVGHEPAVPELAWTLPRCDAYPVLLERMRGKFPTAAVAVVEFTGSWQQLEPGSGGLIYFITPRELPAG